MKAITDVSVTITRLVSPDILKYYTLNSQRWVDIGGDINIRVKRPELVKDFDKIKARFVEGHLLPNIIAAFDTGLPWTEHDDNDLLTIASYVRHSLGAVPAGKKNPMNELAPEWDYDESIVLEDGPSHELAKRYPDLPTGLLHQCPALTLLFRHFVDWQKKNATEKTLIRSKPNLAYAIALQCVMGYRIWFNVFSRVVSSPQAKELRQSLLQFLSDHVSDSISRTPSHLYSAEALPYVSFDDDYFEEMLRLGQDLNQDQKFVVMEQKTIQNLEAIKRTKEYADSMDRLISLVNRMPVARNGVNTKPGEGMNPHVVSRLERLIKVRSLGLPIATSCCVLISLI